MKTSKTDKAIASDIAKKMVANEGLRKIHHLLGKFKANDLANQRIAIVGISILLAIFVFAILTNALFNEEPDHIVNGKVLQLKIEGETGPPEDKLFLALVELETGGSVWSEVRWEIFSYVKPGHRVEVGYVSNFGGSKYKLLRWQKPSAP